jgi:hypothetical protein
VKYTATYCNGSMTDRRGVSSNQYVAAPTRIIAAVPRLGRFTGRAGDRIPNHSPWTGSTTYRCTITATVSFADPLTARSLQLSYASGITASTVEG